MTESLTSDTLLLPPPDPPSTVARVVFQVLLVSCGVPLVVMVIVAPIITVAWLVRMLLPGAG